MMLENQPIETDTTPTHAGMQQVLFPAGLVGCPDWRRFTLVEHPELPGVFVLQSLDDVEVTYLLAPAAAIAPDFFDRLHVDDQAALATLGVGGRVGVEVFSTLN